MSIENKFKEYLDRAPLDVVGVDCASNAVRTIRMRKTASGFSVAGAELLPPVPILSAMEAPEEGRSALVHEIGFPPRIKGRYAALSAPGTNAVLKLLRLPEKFDLADPEQVLARLGFDKPEGYRVATRVIQPATARTEALVLAAAMPERMAEVMLRLLPKTGLPAPRFIGISELAVVNAFHNDPRRAGDATAHGLIHLDHDFSLLALFNQERLSQLRTFPFGMSSVFKRIMKVLNVDEETASGVLSDGAFDISHLIDEQTKEVRAQYVVCRDFMERSENCSLKKLYVSGPAALTAPFLRGEQSSEVREAWNALDAHADRAGGCMTEQLALNSWPLTAAIGACMGVLAPS